MDLGVAFGVAEAHVPIGSMDLGDWGVRSQGHWADEEEEGS